MFLPLIYCLRYEKNNWRILAYILSVIAVIGALSSMSSGPWVMIIVILFCLALEKYKQWTKLMLKFLIFSCVFVELFSNRNFYQVIFSYASRFGGAGWHRAKLIDVAISHFNEWWLAGYGGKDPGWGHYFGMSWTDVTNEFVLVGIRYGMAGVIVLCVVIVVAFRSLISAHKKAAPPADRSLYWALGCILITVITVWMSVSFFGQLVSLFYCMLGIISSMSHPGIVRQVKIRRVVLNNKSEQSYIIQGYSL
jgi:hypothetical protein